MKRKSTPSETKPLATLALLSYNQESFIAEALLAALSQTYSPLEVIVSDDGSVDGSVEIIRAIVESYSGPHTVIVNVNQHNLGIGAHVSKIARLASGRVIVLAGGDDISLPARVSRVMGAWSGLTPHPSGIFCGAEVISKAGRSLGPAQSIVATGERRPETLILYKGMKTPLVLGACGAYDVDIFARFGALDPDLSIEDIPLLIRASATNGIIYLDENLVKYRRDVSVWKPIKNDSESDSERRWRRRIYTEARMKASRQVLKDMLLTQNTSYIESALRAHALHEYVHETCVSNKFSLPRLFAIAIFSRHWLYPMATTLFDAFPRIASTLLRARATLMMIRGQRPRKQQ